MIYENNFKNDEELFKDAKSECNITWQDEDTDRKIKNAINQGIDVLQNDVGTSINFDEDLQARGLLKTYVRYVWNNFQRFLHFFKILQNLLKLEVKYGES